MNHKGKMPMPKKKDFRQHAHVNPYLIHDMEIPISPNNLNYPPADFVDIGCGYGKFLIYTAEKYSDKVIYGMEIRKKVHDFVELKIKALKENNQKCEKKDYLKNVFVIRTNALLFFPHFFKKSSLEKIFILFPDPQFKKKKKRVRIISLNTIHFYEYCLKQNGKIYLSTDVQELFLSFKDAFSKNSNFKALSEEESVNDDFYNLISTNTDESSRAGAKVDIIYKIIYQKM